MAGAAFFAGALKRLFAAGAAGAAAAGFLLKNARVCVWRRDCARCGTRRVQHTQKHRRQSHGVTSRVFTASNSRARDVVAQPSRARDAPKVTYHRRRAHGERVRGRSRGKHRESERLTRRQVARSRWVLGQKKKQLYWSATMSRLYARCARTFDDFSRAMRAVSVCTARVTPAPEAASVSMTRMSASGERALDASRLDDDAEASGTNRMGMSPARFAPWGGARCANVVEMTWRRWRRSASSESSS